MQSYQPAAKHCSLTRPPTTGVNRRLQAAALVSLNKLSPGDALPGPGSLSARDAKTEPLKGASQMTEGSYSARGPPKHKNTYTGPLWRESEPEPPQPDVCGRLGLGDPSKFLPVLQSLADKVAQKWMSSNPREVFKYVDLTRDGCVVLSEVEHLFRVFNLPQPLAVEFFHFLDTENRKDIRFGDFVEFLWPYLAPGTEPTLPDREDYCPFEHLNWKPDTKEGRQINKTVKESLLDIKRKIRVKFKYARDAFTFIDCNKDGRITQEEMNEFFRAFGWGHVSDDLFAMMDGDRSGEVDYAEFMSMFGDVLGKMHKLAPHTAMIPVDGDKELESAINTIGRLVGAKLYSKYDNVQQAWREINLKKDGKISRAELDMFFKKMILPADSSEMVLKALDKDMSAGIERAEFVKLFGPVLPNL